MVLISRCSSVCLSLLCFLFVNKNTMTVLGGKNCCYFWCLIYESLFLMLLKICCAGRGEVLNFRLMLFLMFFLQNMPLREGRSVAARSKLLGLHSPVLASLLGNARFATFYLKIFSLVI